MNYKLINNQTKEEHLCDKVTIDGFDYYVDNKVVTERFEGYLIDDEGFIRHGMSCEKSIKSLNGKKVIATNNPNIDIPKVVTNSMLIEKLAKILTSHLKSPEERVKGVVLGYDLSQGTHPFSEEDIIDFDKWKTENYIFHNDLYITKDDYYSIAKLKLVKHYSTKELLQIWKEQQPKIVYYNE